MIETKFDRIARSSTRQTLQAIGDLAGRLEVGGCRFGRKVIPSFIKPHFLSRGQTRQLRFILLHLGRILEKIVRVYFEHPELKPIYGISREADKYIRIDPGYSRSVVIARPDAFLNQGRFQFLEFNCDSPAGPGYADVQEEILKGSSIMRELLRQYGWETNHRQSCLIDALLECYREYGGKHRHPQIAIVDWRSVKTHPEFVILRDLLRSRGYPCAIADPRELKMRGGRLTVKGFRIDLVYRRVIFDELMAKRDEVGDFLKAYRLGKVCVVNPLRSRLAANKAVLSIITNPAHEYLFTRTEIAMIARHVPWTRRVIDSRRFYGGKTRYLREFINDHRENLVLKPAESYGGRDVKIGRETSRRAWLQTIVRAIRGSERWVVQEFVPIPEMRVPVRKGKKLHFVKKKININPFLFGGRYGGAMARLSDESVINVSAGGGLIPTISYRTK